MRRILGLLLLVVGLLGLAACGDDGGGTADADRDDDEAAAVEDETTTTAGADNDVVCEHLATVDRLDAESGRVTDSAVAQMNAGADPSIVIAALHESADLIESSQAEATAEYAAAAAAASPEVAADIEALAASSNALAPSIVAAFRAVDSVEDMATLEQVFDTPELQEAARTGAAAAQSLSRFTDVVCGFSMTD